jgi:hypothetical protein
VAHPITVRALRRRHLPARNATAGLAMVISSRHRLIGALVLAATGLSLGGCQKAVSVVAVNHCGADLEIEADSVGESSSRWTRLRAGDRDSMVDVPENIETLTSRCVRRAARNPKRRPADEAVEVDQGSLRHSGRT